MNIERKSYPVADLKVSEDAGVIEAIVSVFNNTDSGNEIVRPGFFQKSIERKLPKGVWAHDWKQPIAKTLEARELLPGDPSLPIQLAELGGTYIKGQFNLETQRGREAYSDIKFGIVDEFSIGYRVIKDKTDEAGTRELLEGDWAEWSPVLVGMNDQTHLISIKEHQDSPKPIAVEIRVEDSKFGDAITAHIVEDVNEADKPKSLDGSPAGLTFEEHSQSVLAAVSELIHRTKEITELRKKEGRAISTVRRARLTELLTSLKTVTADIEALLAETEPMPKDKGLDVDALRMKSLRLQSEGLEFLSQL